MKKVIVCLSVSAAMAAHVFGAGFGLYETSSKAMNNGGHRVGKAVDASAVYYNPATMSGLTGTWVTVGAVAIHTPLDTRVNGEGTHKMDPGWVYAPCAFITQELPWGLTAGLGSYADFGLRSHYDNNWPLSWNSVETEFTGYTLSPALSYKVTDDWSIAAGLRFSYVNFTQRRLIRGTLPRVGTMNLGRLKIDADNDMLDLGWYVGTAYELFDGFSVGAVYRSRVRTDLEGDVSLRGGSLGNSSCRVHENLDLPASANIGFNWDVLERWHLGASATWTEWSTLDKLDIKMPNAALAANGKMNLDWRNTYRVGFGVEYDFSDWLTGGVGYVYDWDPTRENLPQTMLPAGDRHNIYFGPDFRITENLEFSIMLGMVLMESKTAWFSHPVTRERQKFQSRNSHTYLVGATLSYHF